MVVVVGKKLLFFVDSVVLPLLLIVLFGQCDAQVTSNASGSLLADTDATLGTNFSREAPESTGGRGPLCRPGLILPVFEDTDDVGTIIGRGILYFLALSYMFVGVSIVADRFMASIEVITSKEKDVIVTHKNGEFRDQCKRTSRVRNR